MDLFYWLTDRLTNFCRTLERGERYYLKCICITSWSAYRCLLDDHVIRGSPLLTHRWQISTRLKRGKPYYLELICIASLPTMRRCWSSSRCSVVIHVLGYIITLLFIYDTRVLCLYWQMCHIVTIIERQRSDRRSSFLVPLNYLKMLTGRVYTRWTPMTKPFIWVILDFMILDLIHDSQCWTEITCTVWWYTTLQSTTLHITNVSMTAGSEGIITMASQLKVFVCFFHGAVSKQTVM